MSICNRMFAPDARCNLSWKHRGCCVHRELLRCRCGQCVKERKIQSGTYRPGNTRHGMKGTLTYRIWLGIRERLYNPKSSSWKDYGGRGIDRDPRWAKFETFLADMGICPDGMTLDRINNDRGYWPDNCRWSTCREQSNNRRNTRHITLLGKTDTMANWARSLGLTYAALRSRLRQEWSEEMIVNQPCRKRRSVVRNAVA